MSISFIYLVGWKTEGPPHRFPLSTYINHAREQEVYLWGQKALMHPRYRNDRGVHIEAFLPDSGLWCDVDGIPDGKVRISPAANTLIVRYVDVPFCEAFGEALTKTEWLFNKHKVVWPAESGARNVVIHGAGTRIIRVIFWPQTAGIPTEFAIRMDHKMDVVPVVYDALSYRFHYHDSIELWNVANTAWSQLPKESSWHLDTKHSTVCIRAMGVGFTPGLGWEITHLERQHGRDAAISVPRDFDEEE